MTAAIFLQDGRRNWSLQEDDEGHRDYTLITLVRTTDKDDGPYVVRNTPGLPLVGAPWVYGNDSDPWAFRHPSRLVKLVKARGYFRLWTVQDKFSTRPLRRCEEESIEDPLLEPDRVGGSFIKYTKEVARDKDGKLLKSSSHELYRGPQVEFDHNRPTVWIEQNVAALGLATFSQMVDTVNDATLWGLGARRIKLSNVTWEKVYYGLCDFYYVRRLEFDIDFNTFDRDILDEGTKVLSGRWPIGTGTTGWILVDVEGSPPNKLNPQHFIRYKDRKDENARVVLDGNGEPLGSASPVYHNFKRYKESNFLLLGIPTVF